VDKLIGKAFLKGVSIEHKILLTSGRVTSEIMTKAGRNRFPSSSAVQRRPAWPSTTPRIWASPWWGSRAGTG